MKTDVDYVWCAVDTDDGYVVLDTTNRGRVHLLDKQGDVTHMFE